VSSWRSNVAEGSDAPPESLYKSGLEASASSCNAEIHVCSHAYHRHISRRAEARRGANIAWELSLGAVGTKIHVAARVTVTCALQKLIVVALSKEDWRWENAD